MSETLSISVIGLGKLGATMVGCFATRGFRVIGVDIRPEVVTRVHQGRAPVQEPGLQALYDRARGRITATADVGEAVRQSQVSFVIVPTPSKSSGEFDTRLVETAAAAVGRALRQKRGYHLVVLTSTVLPGATEARIKTVLERSAGKSCGKDFGLCYSPEFIALGDVVHGLLHPDFFLVGEYDARSGALLAEICRRLGGPKIPIVRMSIVNAELTKIAVNTFITGKISFANTLAQICSRLPGGDARVVAGAVGLDRRIGARCLMPGAAFGGPCFPRDNRAFAWLARRLGMRAPLAEATDVVNRAQLGLLANLVAQAVPAGGRVAVLGLSYKPQTGVMEESQGVAVAAVWSRKKCDVRVYDPLAEKQAIAKVLPRVNIAASAAECVRGADVIVLATDHDEFRRLSLRRLLQLAPHAAVVDFWGLWRAAPKPRGLRYLTPGVFDGSKGRSGG